MRTMLRLFDFYIFANIHVALATFSLTKISLLFVGNDHNEVPLFVLFSTIVAYNFIRLYRKTAIESWFSNWIDNHKIAIIVLSCISLVAMCYLAVGFQKNAILSLLPFFIMTFFYSVPMGRKFSLNTSLRVVARIKIFIIGLCWAGVTVIFPLLNYDVPINQDVLIIFTQRFLFVVAITIPFDIRDLSHDPESLKTIPQLIGVEQSKKVGLFLLMIFLGLEFLASEFNQMRITFVITLISLFLLIRSTTNQSKYYSAFFVESIPIAWLLLILI